VHALANTMGIQVAIEAIAKPTKERATYHGWWTLDELKSLGFRAPQNMTRSEFLDRCATVAILLERLKEAPLRKTALAIGLSKDEMKKRQTLQLLGVVAVIGDLAVESGMTLPDDAEELAGRWNAEIRVEPVKRLLALRDLREIASHPTGEGVKKRIANDLEAFGIDPASCYTGWGRALDRVYDLVTSALNDIAASLRKAISSDS
jgi:hypothetical protein